MSSPLVSVIVPVYKAQDTIRKCLDSFIDQTLSDWELVLIDDGSPDESGKVCDEYALRDTRIKVIHKENAGVSAARQTGLDVAKGEYIIHADPDDWVEPTMIEELYQLASSDGSDMVICDFYIDFRGHTRYSQQRPSSLNPSDVLYDIFSPINGIHGSCCNKLVKKECIDRCHAKFPDGVDYCEDVCFISQLLKNSIKISYLDKAFYHYVQNNASITNLYTKKRLDTQKKYVSFVSTLFPESSIYVVFAKELVKKQAFQSGSFSKEEFSLLYPEIKRVHGGNILSRTIFRLAFSGSYHLALIINRIIH